MKKSSRILFVLSMVAFGLGIVIGAISIVCLFFPLSGAPKFGFEFIPAVLEFAYTIFDFHQWTYDIFIQYTVIAIIGVGGLIALVWLILGLCRKHFIEILFFFLTIVCFAYFAFIVFFGVDYLLDYIETGDYVILSAIMKSGIFFIYLVPIILIIITFAYDMKRIFSKKEAEEFVEAPQYTSHELFEEMFPEETKAKDELTPEERERIERALLAEAEKMIEEEKKNAPLAPEDIPPVLYEEEPELEVPPILYAPDKEEEPVKEEVREPLRPEDIPPILRDEKPAEDKDVLEPLRPEDIPPILYTNEEAEEVEKEEPLRPEDIPPVLFREDKPEERPYKEFDPNDLPEVLKKKEIPYERPACLDRKEPEYETPPFMKEGFVPRREKESFPTQKPAPKKEEVEHLPIFDKAPVTYYEAPKSNGKAYHLSHKEEGWVIKAAGEKVAEAILASESDAIAYVRHNYPGSSIRIHDKDGKIRSI